MVIGVSKDSSASHKKFVEKNNLPFILLADTGKEALSAYDVLNALGGTQRTTYVIGPDGVIGKVYDKVNPDNNATQILEYLKTARK